MEASPQHGSAVLPTSDPDRTSLHVLIVEDNVDAADSLRLLLVGQGHTVDIGRDGPAGLELARQTLPDVVLLDLGLPRMDGYEFARQLRRQPGQGRRPFLIAVTGYGQDEDRCRAREAGIDLHFLKPADPVRLLDLLQSYRRLLHSNCKA